jgi:hypothetical protein
MTFDPSGKGQHVELGTLADVVQSKGQATPSAAAKINAAVSRIVPKSAPKK